MTYNNPIDQRSMVLDDHRNGFYGRALQRLVRPDTVVMDLGAGLGILGFIAAAMGARHVYMIEPATNPDAALLIARENGLSDKITFIPQAIERISLDEPVDIITSVFTGNFLLEEDLLPSLFLARDKYLKPGGTLIPDSAGMWVMPVSFDDYYSKQIQRWSEGSEGITHASMLSFALNSLYIENFNEIAFLSLGEAQLLHKIDFLTANRAECHQTVKLDLSTGGELHGFICWFDASLDGEILSTAPDAEPTHWGQVFLPMHMALVSAGDELELTIDRSEFGEWHWRVGHGGSSHQYSSFKSAPLTVPALARRSESFQPTLSREGSAARDVLSQFNSTRNVAVIATSLLDEYTDLFHDLPAAIRFTQALTENYSE